MTPIKKCNRPGGICNRSCMGGGVVGSPERECPFPEQAEPERKPFTRFVIWFLGFAAFAAFAIFTYLATRN